MSRVLGKAVYGAIEAQQVEWWELPPNVHATVVQGTELSALCPVTGNPDIYDYEITFDQGYEPESKSLKMYLLHFRDERLSCAALAGTIAAELSAASDSTVAVSLTQQTRGGMRLTSYAEGATP